MVRLQYCWHYGKELVSVLQQFENSFGIRRFEVAPLNTGIYSYSGTCDNESSYSLLVNGLQEED